MLPLVLRRGLRQARRLQRQRLEAKRAAVKLQSTVRKCLARLELLRRRRRKERIIRCITKLQAAWRGYVQRDFFIAELRRPIKPRRRSPPCARSAPRHPLAPAAVPCATPTLNATPRASRRRRTFALSASRLGSSGRYKHAIRLITRAYHINTLRKAAVRAVNWRRRDLMRQRRERERMARLTAAATRIAVWSAAPPFGTHCSPLLRGEPAHAPKTRPHSEARPPPRPCSVPRLHALPALACDVGSAIARPCTCFGC